MPAANPWLGLRVLTVLLLPGSRLSVWLKLTAALSRWRRESYKWTRRGALGGATGGLLLLAAGCLARRCELPSSSGGTSRPRCR
jgi:hypothetical protein